VLCQQLPGNPSANILLVCSKICSILPLLVIGIETPSSHVGAHHTTVSF
jgi:hypothetical protein